MKVFVAILAVFLLSLAAYAWLSPKPTPSPSLGAQEETYFAEIAPNGDVLRVIVADQSFVDSGAVGDPKNWVQTYRDGRRGAFAGKGQKYDKQYNAFIPPKPSPDAVLDANGAWTQSTVISASSTDI